MNKMIKKIITSILTIAMVFAMMPTVIARAEVNLPDGAKWLFDSDTQEYSDHAWYKYDATEKTIYFGGEGDIPYSGGNENRDYYEIVNSIEKAVFEDTITGIAALTLYNATSLKEVTFPSNLKTIDNRAFENCQNLEEASLPDGLTTIGDGAFTNCYKLKLSIPASVTSIGDGAFRECNEIEEFVNSNDGLSVGGSAFYWCKKLKKVEITGNNVEIGTNAFQAKSSDTPLIKSVVIPGNNVVVGESAFGFVSSIETLSISGNNVTLKHDAFDSLENLTTLNLTGENITLKDGSLGDLPFDELTLSAKGLVLEGNAIQSDEIQKLVINGQNIKLKQNALSSLYYIENVVFEGANTEIGEGIFVSEIGSLPVTKIEFKTIPSEIDENAFDMIAPPILYNYLLMTRDYNAIEDETIRNAYIAAMQAKADASSAAEEDAAYEQLNSLLSANRELFMSPYGDPTCELKLPSNWTLDQMKADGSFYGGKFKTISEPDVELKQDATIDKPTADEVVNITPEVKDNDLSAQLADTDLKEALKLTAPEQTNGVWAWMELKAKEVNSADVPSADKTLIAAGLNGKTLGTYLDISIFKQIAGQTKTKLNEKLGEKVTITVTVPASLRAIGKDFAIVYTHDGGAAKTILPESYNETTGELVFKADEFSTYALVYTPKSVTPTPTPTPAPSNPTPYKAPNTSVR